MCYIIVGFPQNKSSSLKEAEMGSKVVKVIFEGKKQVSTKQLVFVIGTLEFERKEM